MADGTRLTILGLITLEFELKGVLMRNVFAVGPSQKDAILGMPFLYTHQCTMVFGTPEVFIDGRRISCAEKYRQRGPIDQQETRQYPAPRMVEPVTLTRSATGGSASTTGGNGVRRVDMGGMDPDIRNICVDECDTAPG